MLQFGGATACFLRPGRNKAGSHLALCHSVGPRAGLHRSVFVSTGLWDSRGYIRALWFCGARSMQNSWARLLALIQGKAWLQHGLHSGLSTQARLLGETVGHSQQLCRGANLLSFLDQTAQQAPQLVWLIDWGPKSGRTVQWTP